MRSPEITIVLPEMAKPQIPDDAGDTRETTIYPRPIQIPERKPITEPITPREPVKVPQREPVPLTR